MSITTARTDLAEKVIIVTGAGSGIGRATALLAGNVGACVVAVGNVLAPIEETAHLIENSGGVARPVLADVGRESDVQGMVDAAIQHFGRLDGAFNNAGVEMRYKSVEDLTFDDWRAVMRVNLDGVFLCLKYEALAMRRSGGGSIVNTGSTAAVGGQARCAEYAAAKHGVLGLTRTASIDLGQYRIRVNAVNPGLTMTPLARSVVDTPAFASAKAKLMDRANLGHFAEPCDIAEAAVWLLSDRSAIVTGTTLAADGGYTSH